MTTLAQGTSGSVGALARLLEALTGQRSVERTLHDVLYGAREVLPFSSGAVILKDPRTERLVIANRCNITAAYAEAFSRTIGHGRLSRLYYQDQLVVYDPAHDADAHAELQLEHEYRTGVCVRMVVRGRTAGYLALFFDEPFEPTAEARAFLLGIARVCALAVHLGELEDLASQLRQTDPASGALTYHFFYDRLGEAFRQASRYGQPLSLGLLDLDNYNELASVHGLEVAQEVYRGVARTVQSGLREVDLLARYGKDELVVLLPNTGVEGAVQLFERLQQEIAATAFTDRRVRTTASVGVTERREEDALDGMLLRLASALHHARVAGSARLAAR